MSTNKGEQSDHYTKEYSRIRKLTSRYDIRTQSVRILSIISNIYIFLNVMADLISE